MNKLESVSVTSPYGKPEMCSKFTITDVTNPFLMADITAIGQDYTLSFWVRSETDGSVTVSDTQYDTTAEWTKHSLKFTADSVDMAWFFDSVGVYYIYHSQLETGNQVTDWRPNPDDVEQSINDSADSIREEIIKQNTSFISTADAMIMSAVESRVAITDYGEFRDSVESRLTVMADDISMNFETTTTKLDELDEDTQSKFTKMYKHISFSSDGIMISAGENSMSIRINNNIVSFEKNGKQFGWWDGVDFHTGNIMVNVTERAQFGNFAFVPRTDGSLSFLKVAHNTGFYAVLGGGTMTIFGAYPTLVDNTLYTKDIPAVLSDNTLFLGG